MAIKAILASEAFDELSEDMKAHYKQDGDNYVIQVDGLENHPQVRGVVTANNENKKKRDTLKAKVDELEGKIKEFPDDFDAEEWNKLKLVAAEVGNEPDKFKKIEERLAAAKKAADDKIAAMQKKHADELAERDARITELDAYIERTERDVGLTKALTVAGVKPELFDGAHAMMSPKIKVLRDEESGKRRAVFETAMGEQSIDDYVADWAQSDAGKPYIAPSGGPGAKGNNGSTGGGKTILRSQWDTMSHVDRAKAAKEGKTVIDG